jgi:hypothetical protein
MLRDCVIEHACWQEIYVVQGEDADHLSDGLIKKLMADKRTLQTADALEVPFFSIFRSYDCVIEHAGTGNRCSTTLCEP